MDDILPALNGALNTLARERPDQPLQALAALLIAAAPAPTVAAAATEE